MRVLPMSLEFSERVSNADNTSSYFQYAITSDKDYNSRRLTHKSYMLVLFEPSMKSCNTFQYQNNQIVSWYFDNKKNRLSISCVSCVTFTRMMKSKHTTELILENKDMRYNEKGQESSVKGHSYELFPLHFPNWGHLECYVPLSICGFEVFYRK